MTKTAFGGATLLLALAGTPACLRPGATPADTNISTTFLNKDSSSMKTYILKRSEELQPFTFDLHRDVAENPHKSLE